MRNIEMGRDLYEENLVNYTRVKEDHRSSHFKEDEMALIPS